MRGPYRTHSFIAFSLSLALGPACTEFEFRRTTAPEPTSPVATPSATPPATPTPIVTSTTTMPTPPPPTPIPTPTTPPPEVTPAEQLPPIFAEPVRTARAAPISGGTLLVTADGTTAVAADVDRDQVFLVDLASHAVRSVSLDAGSEPGRVVEGSPGTVFIATRRTGMVFAVNVESATITGRYPVCNAPRGMAYEPARAVLHVACRSGRLVSLDASNGVVVSTLTLEDDLRDVLVVNGALVVTRFRSAEILALDGAGAIRARGTPPSLSGSSPSVAFRGVALPNGTMMVAHQHQSTAPLGTGFGAYYGGGCSGGGVVEQTVTVVSLDGRTLPTVEPNAFQRASTAASAALPMVSQIIGGALGPLDLAVSRDGLRMAVVASGNSWQMPGELPALYVTALNTDGDPPATLGNGTCGGGTSVAHYLPGEPVSVAFDAAGRYVVQSREPAMLELEGDIFITLSAESHFDTGHAMFHLNTGGGISCASCHPEGGEDGHVWSFSGVGLRRSQALEGGASARSPFHWSGDLPTFTDLFNEVMLNRMALPVTPPPEDVDALVRWMDTIPALPPGEGLDAESVERGRALFFDPAVKCGECHSGPTYSDERIYDVGTGGEFVTPSLLGVGLRAPLMHDGCAADLRARFGICGGSAHGDLSQLDESDFYALVAFMKSL